MVLVTELGTKRRNSPEKDVRPERNKGLNETHKSILAWHVLALVCYFCSKCVYCDAQETDPFRLVDLSHTFDETSIYWVTSKKLNFTVTYNGTAPDDTYWYQSDEISAGTHGGTHMDAPCHFALGRWCISDIPARHLVATAAVVDISLEVGSDPNVHLTANHLKEWEKVHGKIPDSSLLLVRTGWSRFWPDHLKYTGTTERNASLLKFPSISADAAEWLVANRNIVGVGIDVMSVDEPGKHDTHVTLMEKNIYGLENVNLAESLPPTGVKVYAMPMKLRGASGAPCRILAEIPKDVASGNTSSSSLISQSWTIAIAAIFWMVRSRRL